MEWMSNDTPDPGQLYTLLLPALLPGTLGSLTVARIVYSNITCLQASQHTEVILLAEEQHDDKQMYHAQQ